VREVTYGKKGMEVIRDIERRRKRRGIVNGDRRTKGKRTVLQKKEGKNTYGRKGTAGIQREARECLRRDQ
jgi:hypothetical protein